MTMIKPSAADFATQGSKYLGTPYEKMDCQAFVEAMLRDVGVKKDYSGSNAMFRDCSWVGTPEEAVKKFGSVPVGSLLFIWNDKGGEVKRGYKDGLGDAEHVGVKTGTGLGAIHSSSTRKCVAESEFKDKTIPNGGWNRVGLFNPLDYGVDVAANVQTSSAPADNNTASPTYAYSTIKKGDKGVDVEYAQNLLLALGYELPKYGADGSFGDETIAAVKAFQKDEGLPITGVIDPVTWSALGNEIANPTPKGQTSSEVPTTGQTSTPSTQPSTPVVTSYGTATVYAENGKAVKMRQKPSASCNLYRDVPHGSVVMLRGPVSGGWTAIRWNGRDGYMMSNFLITDEQPTMPDPMTDTVPDEVEETYSSYALEFYGLNLEQAQALQAKFPEYASRIEGRNG